MNYSDMVEINVEVEALNLDGIKQNLLDYVQKEVKISIEESVEQAGKSAKDAEDAASVAEDAATSAADCARQASESLGLYYTKEQSDTLLSSKQDTITGAATTITDNNLTANRSLTSNSNGKVDVATTTTTELNYVHGVTSAIQTQLNAKASTALDNLSSDGQMIIDSANGTISNCILEIPQNLKLEISGNTFTIKSGSTITLVGETYTTYTLMNDSIVDYSSILPNVRDGIYYIFSTSSGVVQSSTWISLNHCFSGTPLPDASNYSNGDIFFETSEKKKWYNNNGTWVNLGGSYPLGLFEVKNHQLSFAKDSKGRDIIFNGAGFIGHHAFVYPNVKSLIPNGFNSDGTLKSILVNTNALIIRELSNGSTLGKCFTSDGVDRWNGYIEVETYDDFLAQRSSYTTNTRFYVKEFNKTFVDAGESIGILEQKRTPLVYYSQSSNIVTEFSFRQPYEGARYLLTDDLYKQIGDVETLLAAI